MLRGAAWSGQIERYGPSVLAAGSATAGALAGCHPTRTPVVDPLYTAVLAGLVVLGGARAARGSVLWLAVVGTALSRGVLLVPAASGLAVAFAGALRRQPSRLVGALAAALSIQAVLRWPHQAFLGATALAAGAAVLPVLVGTLIGLPQRARRRVTLAAAGVIVVGGVLVVPLLVEGLLSRNQLTLGIDNAEGALHSVSSGHASAATPQLDRAAAYFDSVSHRLDSWWTVGARLIPVAAQQRQAVAVASSVARDVSVAAGTQAARIDFAQLHYQAGGIDLARVEALAGPLQAVVGPLTIGVHQLAGVRSQWLVSPVASRLARLDREVVRAQSSAVLAQLGVADAPSLLGATGPRHYAVLVIDPAEERGLGGLIVSYGGITADHGRLHLDGLADISHLNSALGLHGGGHIGGPPSYLARYGAFHPEQSVQDITYAPDLPTVTDVLGQLLAQVGYRQLDGVLVVDPESIAALLNFSGSVTAPGLGQLSASNAAQVIEEGEYAAYPLASEQTARRAALSQALQEALGRLTQGSLPAPESLGDALSPVAHRGQLMFWSVHPQDRPLLDRLGVDGTFPEPAGGDLLAVVSQNAANNKIDPYLSRNIDYQVSVDPGRRRVTATLTIHFHNSAPPSGLSSEVLGSFGGSGLAPGTNYMWLSVYSPLDLGATSIHLARVDELGVHTYSGYVEVAPGTTVTEVIQLQGTIASPYRLVLCQQPLVQPDDVTVEVSGSSGWHVRGSGRWVPPHARVAAATFEFHR